MSEDTCVCCGATVPEGRQVCPDCEKGTKEVQTQNNKPHWIMEGLKKYRCSECGHRRGMEAICMNYCPFCGNRLYGVQGK